LVGERLEKIEFHPTSYFDAAGNIEEEKLMAFEVMRQYSLGIDWFSLYLQTVYKTVLIYGHYNLRYGGGDCPLTKHNSIENLVIKNLQ